REQSNDEFIELRNMTDRRIDISFWTISYGPDAVFGFAPGTYIEPNDFFFVVDHNLEPFSDTEPQQRTQAFLHPDYVLNLANDPRFPRLNIKNSGFVIFLRDNRGNVIDIAGGGLDRERLAADGRNPEEMTLSELAPYAYATPPYYGGRAPCPPDFPGEAPEGCNYSMERNPIPGDGMDPANWYRCELDEGGVNVNERFKFIIAAPGESSRPIP
ncbi:MAG: lamin tail domain-containing protein, partial [Deltaproteobacteria bacterium]